jgi:hypothetical protein
MALNWIVKGNWKLGEIHICARCREPISRGKRIYYNEATGKNYHEDCVIQAGMEHAEPKAEITDWLIHKNDIHFCEKSKKTYTGCCLVTRGMTSLRK